MNRTPAKKFCVVGNKSHTSYPILRTWFESQEDAEKHAAQIIHEKRAGNTEQSQTLFIVEIVSAIQNEKPLPPPVRRLNHKELYALMQSL